MSNGKHPKMKNIRHPLMQFVLTLMDMHAIHLKNSLLRTAKRCASSIMKNAGVKREIKPIRRCVALFTKIGRIGIIKLKPTSKM